MSLHKKELNEIKSKFDNFHPCLFQEIENRRHFCILVKTLLWKIILKFVHRKKVQCIHLPFKKIVNKAKSETKDIRKHLSRRNFCNTL